VGSGQSELERSRRPLHRTPPDAVRAVQVCDLYSEAIATAPFGFAPGDSQ